MLAEPQIKLLRDAAKGPLEHVFGFGSIEAAGVQAAHVAGWFDQERPGSFAGGGNCSGDSARHAAIDNDIVSGRVVFAEGGGGAGEQ